MLLLVGGIVVIIIIIIVAVVMMRSSGTKPLTCDPPMYKSDDGYCYYTCPYPLNPSSTDAKMCTFQQGNVKMTINRPAFLISDQKQTKNWITEVAKKNMQDHITSMGATFPKEPERSETIYA